MDQIDNILLKIDDSVKKINDEYYEYEDYYKDELNFDDLPDDNILDICEFSRDLTMNISHDSQRFKEIHNKLRFTTSSQLIKILYNDPLTPRKREKYIDDDFDVSNATKREFIANINDLKDNKTFIDYLNLEAKLYQEDKKELMLFKHKHRDYLYKYTQYCVNNSSYNKNYIFHKRYSLIHKICKKQNPQYLKDLYNMRITKEKGIYHEQFRLPP